MAINFLDNIHQLSSSLPNPPLLFSLEYTMFVLYTMWEGDES